MLYASPPLPRVPVGTALIAVGVGMWTIYANEWRQTGAETFGKPIWWDDYHPGWFF